MADLAELQEMTVLEYSSRRRDTGAGANLFNDDRHREVAVDEWASQLLDTRPFERLDSLKQLGCTYKVFPGAYHTRRQHSLGVAHMAVEHGLQLYRNGARVMAEDLMLLCIAGMLHDIGHGPLSHVFESQILPRLGVTGWKHEGMSEALIDYMATISSLELSPQQWGRVKDMIGGSITPGNGWGEGLEWMPAVVSGDADMDRGDYLLRDSLATGVQHGYYTKDLIRASKVLPGMDGKPTICYAESAQPVLAAQFAARALMHEWVYQQQRVKAVECMMADALFEANHVLRIPELARLSSPISFLSLTDDGLLDRIRQEGHLQNPSFRKAAAILARADAGDIYPMAAELDVTGLGPERLSSSSDTLEQLLAGYCAGLTADDIRVVFAKIDHGRKHEDPLGYVLLYDTQLNTRRAIEGLARPAQFSQHLMRVYLAMDCHRNPILTNSCIAQVQSAVDRFAAERGLQAASTLQQQQQQPLPVLLSSRSSALSSSMTILGALTAMPLPREEVRQLALPVPVTPVVETWSRNRQQQQQQQQQRRTRQRLMDEAPHRLVLQLSSDDDEDELQQLQLQQQQQGWEGLLGSADAQLHYHDADLPPSQLSQLSQVQLPFAYSQEEQ